MKWHGNLLYVRDLNASIAFYSEALGLPLMARPAPHLAIIGLENGVLYLHQDPEDAPEWLERTLESEMRGVGVICHLEVDDVYQLEERLAAAGIEISHGPVEAHGQVLLYVYDPSGYNVVFVQQLSEGSAVGQ